MILELEKAKKLKSKLRKGECCLGAQIALSDPSIVEIFGRAGFDWIVVDTEHAPQNLSTVRCMLQSAVSTSAVPLIRPLRLDSDEIRRYLDMGSPGVLCPFIDSGEEATKLVQACRYPPEGIRGYGPRRAGVFGFDSTEYLAQANEAMCCVPIIESKEAIDRIDEIVSVSGIDAIVIGPMDLSISLGCYMEFGSAVYEGAIKKARAACGKYGKAMGTGCYSLEHAQRCIADGDQMLLVAGDDQFVAAESRRYIAELRKVAVGAVL